MPKRRSCFLTACCQCRCRAGAAASVAGAGALRPAARSPGGAPVAAACRPRAENRARSDFGFLSAGVGAGAPSSASQRRDVKVIRPQHPPPWPIASLRRGDGRALPQEAFARSGAAHAPLLAAYIAAAALDISINKYYCLTSKLFQMEKGMRGEGREEGMG